MQEKMSIMNRLEDSKKGSKGNEEIKNSVTKVKNAFHMLISRLDTATESEPKVCC